MKHLSIKKKSYISGFVDGDGYISSTIFPGKYKYKYRINVVIGITQKTRRRWILLEFKKLLGNYGHVRDRKNGTSEFRITEIKHVELVLTELKESLIIKKQQASLVLQIIEKKKKVNSEIKFIQVSKLVDRVGKLNGFKNRKITSETVKKTLNK